MGFLDKLLKGAVDAIDDAVQQNTGSKSGLGDLLNQAMNIKDQALGTSSSGAGNALPTPKPAEQASGSLYMSGGDLSYSFMVSRDFVKFDSGAGEVDYSAVYAPDFDREKDEDPYTPDAPCLVLVNCAEEEVCSVFEQYKKGGRPGNTMLLEPVSGLGENIFCRLKMKMRGQILYCYGVDRGGEGGYRNCYFGASYPPKVMGTPLENRVIEEVDRAIRTFRESTAN